MKKLEPDFEMHIRYFDEEDFYLIEDVTGRIAMGVTLKELMQNYRKTCEEAGEIWDAED